MADNSLAKKLIGWEPEVTLEEGIDKLKEFCHDKFVSFIVNTKI
ncbi:MAG: hypothetical protein Q8P86_01395 [bacterium]|nr:hypothetical protein [bacterium]